MTGLALLLVVTLLTGSTAALAVMAISLTVPAIVVGPVAGVFGDLLGVRVVFVMAAIVIGGGARGGRPVPAPGPVRPRSGGRGARAGRGGRAGPTQRTLASTMGVPTEQAPGR